MDIKDLLNTHDEQMNLIATHIRDPHALTEVVMVAHNLLALADARAEKLAELHLNDAARAECPCLYTKSAKSIFSDDEIIMIQLCIAYLKDLSFCENILIGLNLLLEDEYTVGEMLLDDNSDW